MTRRIIILTEGETSPITAKTGVSVIRYKPQEVVAVLDSTHAGQTAGAVLGVGGEIPVVASVEEAPAADTLLIGIAPAGGKLPPVMRTAIAAALRRGMTVVSGLHTFLSDDPEFADLARRHGGTIHDVRKNNERDVAHRRNIDERCLRLHTVGNDCSCGKMITSIELTNGLKRQGVDAKFVATGQTGIMIEGDGCPIDCVVSDFVNGAAEKLVLANQHHQAIVVEGQGTLVHPRYSGVTLGLLHGCMPDGLIMCYEVKRTQVHNMTYRQIPPLEQVVKIYELMSNALHPCRIIGFGLNTRLCTAEEARDERRRIEDAFGVPACDTLRDGPQPLVDAAMKLAKELGKGPFAQR